MGSNPALTRSTLRCLKVPGLNGGIRSARESKLEASIRELTGDFNRVHYPNESRYGITWQLFCRQSPKSLHHSFQVLRRPVDAFLETNGRHSGSTITTRYRDTVDVEFGYFVRSREFLGYIWKRERRQSERCRSLPQTDVNQPVVDTFSPCQRKVSPIRSWKRTQPRLSMDSKSPLKIKVSARLRSTTTDCRYSHSHPGLHGGK